MRGGRIDATSAGPMGVPQPQNGIGQFTNQFMRMGYSKPDMIAMTACGHTLGGVHADSFDDIVIPGMTLNDFQLFDGTEEFDNHIATRYINGPDINPLSVGVSIKSRKNSDFQVFSSDNNVTLKAMTDPKTFDSMCVSIFQRMIETVPPSVTLSDIIEPYEVKPSDLQLTLLSTGASLEFSGDIRVRTTVRTASHIDSVKLLYKDINGFSVRTPIETRYAGNAHGFDDNFSVRSCIYLFKMDISLTTTKFYSFKAHIPILTSISSFAVAIVNTGGRNQLYHNNGNWFPISDGVIVQTSRSCVNNGRLNVLAAVCFCTREYTPDAITYHHIGSK
jgi:Peroxidase